MQDMQELLARTQVLRDEQDIYRVLVKYCFLHDQGRPELLVGEVFTEDAVLDFGTGEMRGKDQINQFYGGYAGMMLGTAHHLTNVYIEVSGDTAKSTSYVQAWHWFRQDKTPIDMRQTDIMSTGGYCDDLVRTPQGWRIAKRVTVQFGTGIGVGVAAPELQSILRGMLGRLPQWPFPPAPQSHAPQGKED